MHAGQWAITITGGHVDVTRPTWTSPGTTTAADLANLTDLSRYFTPAAAGPPNVNPHHEHPDRSPPPASPASTRPQPGSQSATWLATGSQPGARAGTGGLSWLTPEAVALLDPWGDSGTPSAGP